jgi:cytoplasmic iron level regulating protein YaaA (DUF328/UPF0246 family)
MLIVISPAKTLDYKTVPPVTTYSQPDYLIQAKALIDILKKYNPAEIAQLMKISDALSVLNAGRFSQWQIPFTPENSKQAIFAFMGEVYEGIDAHSLDANALRYAQQHLRILSGLYGILRPLDLMQAYRLEMGTKLANTHGKDLYAFWGETISEGLNARLKEMDDDELVNLASEEYFKVVKPKTLRATIITPIFEDYKNGQYKIISFYAKRARGLMARFAAMHQINNAEALKEFNSDSYAFVPTASDATRWVFRRKIPLQ